MLRSWCWTSTGKNLTWPFTPCPAERWQRKRGDRVLWLVHTPQVWPIPGPSLLLLWRQLIPTCTQRLGRAEWTKWQQSSWPWRLRPAEWFSLCPHGHRGLAEMACFLRGHLAGLCSYPSNVGTGISTWCRGRFVMDSGKIAYKEMTCQTHAGH